MPASFLLALLLFSGKPEITLEVRLVVPCSAENRKPVTVKKGGPRLCLNATPFLTQDDVQSAEVQTNSKGRPVVFLSFHNDAAVRELQITRKNIGSYVAILLDGQVVSVPLISAASRQLFIDGDFTKERAEAIAARFAQ